MKFKSVLKSKICYNKSIDINIKEMFIMVKINIDEINRRMEMEFSI